MSPLIKEPVQHYRIPANLVEPLWFRRRESLVEDGLVYDPIAAKACLSCQFSPHCFSDNRVTNHGRQRQLLYATLTQLCDIQVSQFLRQNPHALIINVGAQLDTRFYRLDNGLCHWIELDVSEHLVWREKLFHANERYQQLKGSVDDLSWVAQLSIPDHTAVLILCDQTMLECNAQSISKFLSTIGLYFPHAAACVIFAGDQTASYLGRQLGTSTYAHGFISPRAAVLNALPWVENITLHSPLDSRCRRWKLWQRALGHWGSLKYRLTPVLVHIIW
jgi:O-methyltransferase involved in polyketide biosynthesis